MAATLNFKFVANAVGLKKGVDDASKKLSGFQKTTEGVSKKMKLALGGISFIAIVKGLGEAAKAAEEDRISQNLLAGQLRNVAGANDDQVKAVEENISAMSRQFGVADDRLRPALSKLVTMVGDTTKAQKLMSLAMDVAAGTGKPLEAVTLALGKASQGQMGALVKLGVPMLDSIQNTKDLTRFSNDLNKKQREYNLAVADYGPKSKEALKALAKVEKVQGQINTVTQAGINWQADLGKAFEGAGQKGVKPMEQLNVVFGEFKETVGTALLPVIANLAKTLMPIIDKIAPTLGKLIAGLAPIFNALVKALLPLIDKLLPPIIDLLNSLLPIIIPLAQGLTAVLIPTINVLAGVFKGIVTVVGSVTKAFGGIGKAMTDAFKGVGTFLKGLFNGYIGMIEGFVNFFIDGINLIPKGLNSIKFKVPDWVPFIGGQTIGFKVPTVPHIKIPKLAQGGVVMPSPGGSIVNVAEAGQAEAIIPLSKLGNMNGGNTYVININKASITGEEIVRAIRRYEVGQGRMVTL
jgi:hypothetical protein